MLYFIHLINQRFRWIPTAGFKSDFQFNLIIFAGVLSTGMALFAERHQDYLRKYTELRNEKVKNRPIPYLHGVRKMDSAWGKRLWGRKADYVLALKGNQGT